MKDTLFLLKSQAMIPKWLALLYILFKKTLLLVDNVIKCAHWPY